MWSNNALALTTLLSALAISFLWAVAVFHKGDSIPLAHVHIPRALGYLVFCIAAFWLLCVVAYLPVRRPIIIELLIGTGLLLVGAWHELLGMLVISSSRLVHWVHIVSLPAGTLITAFGLFHLGKAYQLNRLLLGSYRKIEHSLATVDQLSQVYNRRYFFSVCPELMRSLNFDADTTHKPALALLKIANLPDINVSHGFDNGDNALSHVGRSLQRYVRGQNIAARLSGSTFAIFLPDATFEEAENLCQRLWARSRYLLVHQQLDEDASCTLEINYVICCAEGNESFEQLLARTKLLYQQKFPTTPDSNRNA